MNLPTEENDGHEWTVSEDWKVCVGLQDSIFQIKSTTVFKKVENKFCNKKVFLNIVKALAPELDQGKSIKEQKKARHQAKAYIPS